MKHLTNKNIPALFALILGLCQAALAQPAITFNGDYNYGLNAAASGTIALTPDQKFAVTLTREVGNSTVSITSFNPITGAKIDTETFNSGFNVNWIGAVSNGSAYRVAAMLNGGVQVKIFDMDQSGNMTFRVNVMLTAPGETGSMVLSSSGQVGFTRTTDGTFNQVVSFSLDTGAELDRIASIANFLTIFDNGPRRLIATGSSRRLDIIDATNPADLQSANVQLPTTGTNFGTHEMATAFSADGNYVFAGGGFALLSAVNTNTMQIAGTFNNAAYRARQMRIFESGGVRTIAIRSVEDEGAFKGFALFNAADPANITLINELALGEDVFSKRDFALSRDGTRLLAASDNRLIAYSVPALTTVFENALNTSLAFNILTYGQRERILGSWGSTNSFGATVYFMPNRTNRLSNFDADAKTDIALFRPSEANWYSLDSSTGAFRAVNFGQPAGDTPVPGDYDGDGVTDVGVYRSGTGEWLIRRSSNGTIQTATLGGGQFKPAQADFDGDGKTDIAVFLANPSRWYVIRSSDGATIVKKIPGLHVQPAPGDFDGDGTDDFAVFATSGQWHIVNSSSGSTVFTTFGMNGDVPVSGDWDNDGRTDLAVYRPSEGTWYMQQSFYGFMAVSFGIATDIPVPADYNGDGRLDLGVYRPSEGMWYLLLSSGPNAFNGGFTAVRFGLGSDVPLPGRVR